MVNLNISDVYAKIVLKNKQKTPPFQKTKIENHNKPKPESEHLD